MASPRATGTALTTLVWILGEVLGGGAGEEVAGGEEGLGPIQWVEEGVMVADKVLNIIMLTSHMAVMASHIIAPHCQVLGVAISIQWRIT